MHVLVTGGTGFIGHKVCRALLSGGHSVTIYSRKPEKVKTLLGDAYRGVGTLSAETIQEPVDAVINLAGEPIADARWSDKRKQLLLDSRIGVTGELIRYLSVLQVKPKVLVSASAVGFYGDRGNDQVTETTAPHDEFTHQLCASWEAEARNAENLGIRVVIPRIGLVVGKGGFLAKMLPAYRLGLGGKMGSGQQWMPWIHVQDLVNVIIYLMEHENCTGPYNAVSPQPVTNKQFTETLGKVLGRPTFLAVPAITLKILLGEMSRLLLTGQRAVPHRLLTEEKYTFQYENLSDALRDVV